MRLLLGDSRNIDFRKSDSKYLGWLLLTLLGRLLLTACSNPDLERVIGLLVVEVAVLILVKNINDVRVSSPDDVVINYNFVSVNNNWIVASIVCVSKDIQDVLRNVTNIIVVVRLEVRVRPGQGLLGGIKGDEAILGVPGRATAVAAHWDHVGLCAGDPGELRHRGAGQAGGVCPVCYGSGVPSVSDGAPDGPPEEGGYSIQHRAQVNLDTARRRRRLEDCRGNAATYSS